MTDVGPIRTCIGCRSSRPQAELLRLYLGSDARLLVGRHGPGRGAWLCADQVEACFATAVQRRAFARAFRLQPAEESVRQVGFELAEAKHPD